MHAMAGRGTWLGYLRRALTESCVPARNWRWMLASLGVGAGFGVVGGLHRMGSEPASMTPEVALTAGRAALFFFAVAWLLAVAIRFGRFLYGRRA